MEARRWQTSARGAAVVFAAALAAHIASLRAGWVLDDWELLVDNPHLRSVSGLRALVTRELFMASGDPRHFPYYRPVSGVVYWLTYQLFGVNALAHHAFNVALHGTCAVLFFFVARGLAISARAALVMAILFAVHPISAEVVAYAGGRQDILGWIFTFGAMLLLLRAPSASALRTFVIAFAGTLLAALTREFFLAAPALHAVVAAARTDGESQARVRARSAVVAASGGAVAVACVLALRRFLGITRFDADTSPARAVGTSAAVLLRLLRDALAPTDIAADVTIAPLSTAGGALVLILYTSAFAFGFVTLRKRARRWPSAFILGCVALAVLVALHTPVALRFDIISDRYAYGAVAGVLLAASPPIDALARRIEPAKTKLYAAALTALVVALVPLTWARAADYANDQTLTLALVREHPDDPRSILSQIVTLRSEGKNVEAFPLCHRYVERMPNAIVVNSCLAEEAIAAKDDARAVKLLEPWLAASPTDESARVLYFQALLRLGDVARLKSALERFDAVTPNAPDIRAAREALAAARLE